MRVNCIELWPHIAKNSKCHWSGPSGEIQVPVLTELVKLYVEIVKEFMFLWWCIRAGVGLLRVKKHMIPR